MFEAEENKIKEIDQSEVVKRFGHVYRQESLSCSATKNTYWYANDYACASLYWITPHKVRIKGTVTLPEYRGFGYGSAMLSYLLELIATHDREIKIESYARNPKWYLEHGFEVSRITPWGVTVVIKKVGGANGSD
jgi:GNAT superfamily N-acetyltransferase